MTIVFQNGFALVLAVWPTRDFSRDPPSSILHCPLSGPLYGSSSVGREQFLDPLLADAYRRHHGFEVEPQCFRMPAVQENRRQDVILQASISDYFDRRD